MAKDYMVRIEPPQALDKASFDALIPAVQAEVLSQELMERVDGWAEHPLPLVDLAMAHIARHRDAPAFELRAPLALVLLWSARWNEMAFVLEPLARGDEPAEPGQRHPLTRERLDQLHSVAAMLEAAALSLQGHWEAAEAAFDAALAQIRKETGLRKGVMPELVALPYVLALLAQQSPGHLDKALKFCLAESGKRQGSIESTYGVMALAIQMRRGDVPMNLSRFRPLGSARHRYRIDLWRWLMRAWLKTDKAPVELADSETEASHALRSLFDTLGLQAMRDQLDGVMAVLDGESASEQFFVPSAQEGWRHALSALATLGAGDAPAADRDERTRLVWVMAIDEDDGTVTDIVPHEQKHGARGWGKPTVVALSRLMKADKLSLADAAVARA
ncbi:MAG: Non-specific serine/threonine protein kinase, partial [Rhizobacter sp.]|nr:Non-specific serine/threonine protein kinase [Rhizobacter sp.]